MKTRFICALFFLPVIGYAAAALPIEFNGVLIQGGKTTVSLLNPNTGTAKWVAIGGKFDTYAVTSYIPDPKGADVVVLTKAGSTTTMRIVMKNSQIVATGPGATTGPVTDAQRKSVLINLRQIQAGADQYFLEYGVNSVSIDQITGTTPEKYVRNLTPAAGESYSGMVITQGQGIKVTVSDGSTVSLMP